MLRWPKARDKFVGMFLSSEAAVHSVALCHAVFARMVMTKQKWSMLGQAHGRGTYVKASRTGAAWLHMRRCLQRWTRGKCLRRPPVRHSAYPTAMVVATPLCFCRLERSQSQSPCLRKQPLLQSGKKHLSLAKPNMFEACQQRELVSKPFLNR